MASVYRRLHGREVISFSSHYRRADHGAGVAECRTIAAVQRDYPKRGDSFSDVIKPRLQQLGADFARIKSINEEHERLSLLSPKIEEVITRYDARLMTIDPIQAYMNMYADGLCYSLHRPSHQEPNQLRP